MAISDKNKQLNIFGPSLNPVSRLKTAMREAIKSGNQSREQIVDRMNAAARQEGLGGGRGSKISLASLDGWVAESKGNMIPVGLLPIFCWAVDSIEPLKVLAGCVEGTIIGKDDAALLELAKLEREEKRIAKKRRQMAARLGE